MPVVNANISIAYLVPGEGLGGNRTFGSSDYTTDANGNVVIPTRWIWSAQLTADIHGYEYDVIVTRLQPDIQATARLTTAKPTSVLCWMPGTVSPLLQGDGNADQRKGFDESGLGIHISIMTSRRCWHVRTIKDALPSIHYAGCDLYDSGYPLLDHGSELIKVVQAGQSGLEYAPGTTRPSRCISGRMRDRCP